MFDPITATIGAVGAIGGGLLAKDASRKATNTAADTQAASSQQSLDAQERMYQQSREDFQPFLDVGRDVGLPGITGIAQGDMPEQQYVNALESLDQNFKLEDSDFYNQAKNELLRTLGNQYSARGLSGSSAAEDAVVRNLYPLMTQEYGRRYNALTDLYNLNRDIGNTKYNRYLDLTKIGTGAANTAGNYGQNYAANVSNIYQNQGNALANLAINKGNNQAQFYSELGALPMQAYGTYNAIQSYKQPGGYFPSGGMGGPPSSMPTYSTPYSVNQWT